MLFLVLYGRHINGSAICAELREKGLPESVCSGILSWPENYGWRDVAAFASESNYRFVYGTSFLLALLPFALHVKFMGGEKINLKKFFAVFAVLLLFTTPMFVYAVDWGRWINIHFMLLLFTSTLLLDKLQIGEEKLTGFPPISACWMNVLPLCSGLLFWGT